LKEKGYISFVDVFLKLGYLAKSDYEDWRFRRVLSSANIQSGVITPFFEPIIVVWSTQSCTSDSITRRFVAVGDKPRLM